jgi:hypothetical protein
MATYIVWVVVNRGDFALDSGQPMEFSSSPPVVRSFCGRCGTPLTYRHGESPDTIDVTTATLDIPDAFPPSREIWLEHKIVWENPDGLLEHFCRSMRDGHAQPPQP